MHEAELGGLLEVLIDHRGKTPKKMGGIDFTESGVPVISAIHVKNGRINWDERRRFVPYWMFKRWMPIRLRRGDVLLTSEAATFGEVAQVESDDDLVLSQRLFALRGKDGVLDSTYLRYFLQSREGQEQLLQRTSGTAVIGIRQAELVKVRIPLPPFDEQLRIAGILATLDDLIGTNRALAHRSQPLAAALASGAPDRVPLSELALVADVRQFRPDGPVDHFSIPAFDETQLPERSEGESIKSGKLLLAEPTVLVSRLNPQTPRVWMAYPNDVPAAASTEFVPLTGADSVAAEEVWAVCAADEFRAQMMARVTGTTGSHQRVDKTAIPQLSVADVRKLNRCERTAIIALVREANASLVSAGQAARVRNELLPLLLSGQVRVEDVAS